MYEEIDYSGISKWTPIIATVFLIIMGLSSIGLFGMPTVPGDEPSFEVQVIFLTVPLIALTLGTILGGLRKRSVRINTDRLTFSDETRTYDDFGGLYTEGDFETPNLRGHPVYALGWTLVMFASIFGGFGLFMLFGTLGDILTNVLLLSLIGVSYLAGVYIAYSAAPIDSDLVKNPLQERITKYLWKEHVLLKLEMECDLVSSIIVKYRVGQGQELKVVDDIHVFAITSTDPPLEVEITIEKMESIGPEYTYYLEEGRTGRSEDIIDVEGKETLLILGEDEMRSFIRVRYEMNSIRAKWALGTPDELCQLMHVLLDQVAQYVDFKTIAEDDSADTR